MLLVGVKKIFKHLIFFLLLLNEMNAILSENTSSVRVIRYVCIPPSLTIHIYDLYPYSLLQRSDLLLQIFTFDFKNHDLILISSYFLEQLLKPSLFDGLIHFKILNLLLQFLNLISKLSTCDLYADFTSYLKFISINRWFGIFTL